MSMTMADREMLSRVLYGIRQKIAGYNSTQKGRMNEATTIRLLIEPVLDALGWDTDDPSQVCREYTTGNGKVDLALLIDDKPVLYIEAKALKESTDDAKWINQTLNYAIADGVEWCVLTNGATYRIFRSHALVNLKGKIFGTVRVSDPEDEAPIESVAASLSLLSPQSMMSKDLNALWGIRVIDRQLEEGLKDIIERPEFHRWLSRSVFKDLNAKQIGQSLQRASFGISYPDGHEYINDLDETKHATIPERPRQSPMTIAGSQPKNRPQAESQLTSRSARKDTPEKPTTQIDRKGKKTVKMQTQEMVERGLLQVGTILTIRNHPGSDAKVVDGRNVRYNNMTISFNDWAKRVLKSSVSVYLYAVMPDGKTLDDLRSSYDPAIRDSVKISHNTPDLAQHDKSKNLIKTSTSPHAARQNKMKIPEMVDSGLLEIGTILSIKNRPGSEARVMDGRHVMYQGNIITFMDWGRRVTGWSTLQIYVHAVLPDGRLLDDLRK